MKSFGDWFNQTGRDPDTKIKSPSDDDFVEETGLPDGLSLRCHDKTYKMYVSACCRVCDKDYEFQGDPANFDQSMSYCGGSPSCCP